MVKTNREAIYIPGCGLTSFTQLSILAAQEFISLPLEIDWIVKTYK